MLVRAVPWRSAVSAARWIAGTSPAMTVFGWMRQSIFSLAGISHGGASRVAVCWALNERACFVLWREVGRINTPTLPKRCAAQRYRMLFCRPFGNLSFKDCRMVIVAHASAPIKRIVDNHGMIFPGDLSACGRRAPEWIFRPRS